MYCACKKNMCSFMYINMYYTCHVHVYPHVYVYHTFMYNMHMYMYYTCTCSVHMYICVSSDYLDVHTCMYTQCMHKRYARYLLITFK